MNRSLQDVLIQAIGEDAAEKAMESMYSEAESIREGRINVCVVIEFPPGKNPDWAKLVTRFTRAPHDKIDFENAIKG